VAIEFKHRGRMWRADTAEEAIELRKKLESADQAAFEAGEELPYDYDNSPTAWTHDSVTDLLKGAGTLQKRFLRVLAKESEIASAEIREKLALGSEVALAGVLSGLSKQLKKMGLKPWDLYTVRVQWTGKSKLRMFSIVRGFEQAAAELGWPDEWP